MILVGCGKSWGSTDQRFDERFAHMRKPDGRVSCVTLMSDRRSLNKDWLVESSGDIKGLQRFLEPIRIAKAYELIAFPYSSVLGY